MKTTNRHTKQIAPIAQASLPLLALIICALLEGSVVGAHAAAVIVPNSSFDTPTLADGGFGLPATSWTGAAVFNPQDAQFSGSSGSGNLPSPALGQQCAYLGSSSLGSLATTSPLTNILADTAYRLTVALGSRLDFPTDPIGTVTLSFLANGTPIPGGSTTITTNTTAISLGTFADFTTSFTTNASSPQIGQNLTASISYTGGRQVMIDNVRVDATAVPEPTSTILLASALSFLWQRRRR